MITGKSMFVRFSALLSLLLSQSICFSQVSHVSFSDKRISYEGRVAFEDSAAVLIWSGTSVRFNFTGTSISGRFKDADTANYYNVIIDHGSIHKVHFDRSERSYVLASGLAQGDHAVQIFKRTEWDKGKTWFYGLELDQKTRLLKPSSLPRRKIEFFGNSITCGYSIEDRTGDSPIGYFENNYDTYAAITARHFNAQYHCTAKSGIGIMISWFPLIMPEMYDRLDPENPASKWNFSQYVPDVVVINLLQNDSWLVKMPDHLQFKNRFDKTPPDEEQIVEAYKTFVQTVRQRYPHAQIICMLGNMDITRKDSPWPGYVQRAVARLNDKRIFTFFVPFKETPGHPKTNEQNAMADALIRFIDKNVQW